MKNLLKRRGTNTLKRLMLYLSLFVLFPLSLLLTACNTHMMRNILLATYQTHTNNSHPHDVLVQSYLPTTRSTATMSGDEVILEARSDELQLVQQVLLRTTLEYVTRALPLHTKQIDLIHDERGHLCLMELEIIEPQLYFNLAPHLADGLAEALVLSLEHTPLLCTLMR